MKKPLVKFAPLILSETGEGTTHEHRDLVCWCLGSPGCGAKGDEHDYGRDERCVGCGIRR